MKKINLAFLLLLAFVCSVNAQEVTKPVLTVEPFTFAAGDQQSAIALRNKVIAAVQQADRVMVVDAANQDAINNEIERRKNELAMDDAGRVGDVTALMSNSLMKGSVDQFNIKRVENRDKKTGKVSIRYEASLSYTLTIINAANGTVLAQKNFSSTGYGDTPNESGESALNVKVTPIKQFIVNTFAVGGKVIAVDKTDKGKAKTVYVDLGSNDGMKKGFKLEVFKEVEIAGEKSKKLIGEIQIEEVMSGSRSLCKVGKGGDEILKCLESNISLPVKTKEQKSSFFKSFIEE